MQINGLQLPRALTRAIDEGRWVCPAGAALRRVFREAPVRAEFYDLERLRERNRRWLDEKDPAYFGHPDEKTPPGDIDPATSLLLGALGPDMPFALDYRVAPAEPRVLYLHSGGDRWILIAGDVEQLLVRLHLGGSAVAR